MSDVVAVNYYISNVIVYNATHGLQTVIVTAFTNGKN